MTADAIPTFSGKWVLVADSPFLPPRDGGQREHAGLVSAAVDAELVGAMVVFGASSADEELFRSSFGNVPFVAAARRKRSPLALVTHKPFVVQSRRMTRRLARRIQSICEEPAAVLACSYKSHAAASRLAKTWHVPVAVRLHNIESEYFNALGTSSSIARRALYRLEALRIRLDEYRLESGHAFDLLADISAVDARRRQGRSPKAVVQCIPPFAVRLPGLTPARRDPDAASVLFVGSLDVPTNIDAVNWLLSEVWPAVIIARPDARLLVVGRGPAAELLARIARMPSVDVHADVSDVEPFLQRATVAINSVRFGSGVNIKLVEYMLAGIPTVTTARSCLALDLEHDTHAYTAESTADFAEGIVELLNDPSRGAAMAERARESLFETLLPDRSIQSLKSALGGT